MTYKNILEYSPVFLGGKSFGAVDANGWVQKKTGSGSHTAAVVNDALTLTIASTSEAAVSALTHNDVLSFPNSTILSMEFEVKTTATLGANSEVAIGLAGAYNAATLSMAEYVLFQANTSNAIVIQALDTVNTYTAVATGASVGQTYLFCKIDFSKGLKDVRFYIDSANGVRNVAQSTTFDLSNYTGNWQPFLKAGKASSADVPIVQIRNVVIRYKSN
jgi:hypothetical protein